MPKKSRRRAPHDRTKTPKLSPEAVERKAQDDLTRGHYRDAIAGFKQLLKQEPRPAWRAALADAYRGRAQELAGKDMLKEALAIWENRAGLGPDVDFEPEHAALLLRMGRVEPLLDLLPRPDALPPAERDRIRSLLAAAVLAGEDAVVERMPADDPVVLHSEPARAALSAYCAGDGATLQAALAAIPFRSPYRDWVQILKALQQLPGQPEAAAGLLERVGDDSAFCRLRRASQLALLPEESFLEAIRREPAGGARFACVLRGWPHARIALWEELNRLGPEPKLDPLLRLMYRHRDALGPGWVRSRSLRLLIPGYPASQKRLKAAGAPRLTAKESLLLAAWTAEQQEDLWDEQECWEDYARHLIREAEAADDGGDADRRQRIALALRRCDSHTGILERATPDGDEENPFKVDDVLAHQLEESLAWDPDDRGTYQRLIGYYRRGKQYKDVRRLVEQARSRWPDDMQVLGAALDNALDTGAFKKAAGVARQMLTLDSINSGVRERLVDAHLAHARKQVLKGRRDLARKELAAAGDWARGARVRDRLDLMSGLVAYIEDAGAGAAELRATVERLGGGVAARLALALAAEALRIAPRKLFRDLGLDEGVTAGRDDLLATLTGLRTYLDGGGKVTAEVTAFLSRALAKFPWQDLSRPEAESACETLRRSELHKVRLSLARAALKRWKGEPLFELHAFEAKNSGRFGRRSEEDIDRLEAALARARAAGDTRTGMRIEEILSALNPFPFGPSPFEPSPPGPMPYDEDPPLFPDRQTIEIMIGALGLDKALDEMGLPPEMKRDLRKLGRKQGNEAVAEALITVLGMLTGFLDEDELPPLPGPPTPKPAAAKRGKRKRRSGDDGAADDDIFEQLDLF